MPMVVQDIGSPEDVEAIRAQRQGWKEAFEAGDAERIMTFYAPGDEIVSYDVMPPLEYSGRKVYIDSWRNFFRAFEGRPKMENKDLQIKCSGEVGFVHSLIRLSGAMNGNPVDMWLRETNCLRKIDGVWLLVHDHVSVPMDFETGQALTTLQP